jgi:flavin-dependent dehydrogenase
MILICDAIIVGYGPVGAVLANILGKHRLSVAVVERMSGIFDKPRACVAHFGNGATVVRPDKYVYGIARNSDQLRAMISSNGQAR